MSPAGPSRSRGKSREQRLRSAAIVKLKYAMLSGKLDKGFQTIFEGVLRDLELRADEVDAYLDAHREELYKICVDEG